MQRPGRGTRVSRTHGRPPPRQSLAVARISFWLVRVCTYAGSEEPGLFLHPYVSLARRRGTKQSMEARSCEKREEWFFY